VNTGWLADPSVLSAGSAGVKVGSEVGYCPGLSLMGSTPSFFPSMVTFNHVMKKWRHNKPHPISVEYIHNHVMNLHDRFLRGLVLSKIENQFINTKTLHSTLPREYRSHTLVFRQPCPWTAQQAVQFLQRNDITIDCRNRFVRIGFGFNHNPEDIDELLRVLAKEPAPASKCPLSRS